MPPHEAPALPSPSPPGAPRRQPTRATRALSSIALGLLAGAALAEGAARWRDGGAFPLVNVYEADEARGVRLRPGAVTRVARPGGEAVTVRVNESGYRGPSWPAPSPGEVLIVGDSQSFGLGVDEENTVARALGRLVPGRSVVDASVPTYGPPEYLRTIDEIARARRPAWVAVVINPMNDLFEIDRPGPERFGVVDGWAVRKAAVPEALAPSPLRQAAVERSHAAFALWRLAREREARALPGEREPSWPELVSMWNQLEHPPRPEAPGPDPAEGEASQRELALAQAEVREAQRALTEAMRKTTYMASSNSAQGREWRAYAEADGDPTDQVFELYYGGCAPPPRGDWHFKTRFEGPRIKSDVEEQLRSIYADRALRSPATEALRAALDRREQAGQRLIAARARAGAASARPEPPRPPPPKPTPLEGYFHRVSALTSGSSARLLVAMLPLSLETSPGARAREGASDDDVGALGALRSKVLREAEASGAIAVDPVHWLSPLGDRAYQPDGHLSAEGHQALAHALAEALGAAGRGESRLLCPALRPCPGGWGAGRPRARSAPRLLA